VLRLDADSFLKTIEQCKPYSVVALNKLNRSPYARCCPNLLLLALTNRLFDPISVDTLKKCPTAIIEKLSTIEQDLLQRLELADSLNDEG